MTIPVRTPSLSFFLPKRSYFTLFLSRLPPRFLSYANNNEETTQTVSFSFGIPIFVTVIKTTPTHQCYFYSFSLLLLHLLLFFSSSFIFLLPSSLFFSSSFFFSSSPSSLPPPYPFPFRLLLSSRVNDSHRNHRPCLEVSYMKYVDTYMKCLHEVCETVN